MFRGFVSDIQKLVDDRNSSFYPFGKSLDEISRLTRNDAYRYFHQEFHQSSPSWLRAHRRYFAKERRSFGEDAFHAMWLKLFVKYRPRNILEIGVYRGSTLSLFAMLGGFIENRPEVHGISPFSPVGDSVSTYLSSLDYKADVLRNFEHFNVPVPHLHEGFSQDGDMLKVIGSAQWDLAFIDGNHDEEAVRSDLESVLEHLAPNGILVVDDSALYTDYSACSYSTRGHPGPSKMADQYVADGAVVEVLSCGHNRAFRKAT